ncbi:hypothetical protein [Brumicola nitratireducens]|uniref:Uncharacterized protein n=1 Tax=Glaciecola nitratireducens (strain JCM 12485 / KCTC 12276 / FR1064) TaxID=1085623 RepID=G4QKQ2_GLANF|nr:hypothetical protein [Glaciecola nitratireducens]AEP30355.1 hypothetical protein GNIT_2254 [Glaciecola nitratireducens FR1064]
MLLVVALFTVLNACTSHIEQVGEKHKEAAQKWKEMANYVSSDLPEFGYTITADIQLNQSASGKQFELTNIQFATNQQTSTLDLLRPQFEFKYICIDSCVQLTEYTQTNLQFDEQAIKNVQEGSFLAKQLQRYEFELFDFYAALFVLNDNLMNLVTRDQSSFDSYLYYLVDQDFQAKTFKEFSAYAKKVLSLSAFNEYLTDPVVQYQSTYNRLYGRPTPSDTVKFKGLVTADERLIKNTDFITEDELMIANASLISEDQASKTWQEPATVTLVQSHWSVVNQLPITLGNTVCSYAQNYFGIVKSMGEQDVSLLVQGQAKQFADGVLLDIEQGSLFSSAMQVSFVPMAEDLVLLKSDLAPCTLQ